RLWNKNYLLLWQGQFVSRIGDQLFEIALVLWIMHLTNSASIMGILLMVTSIPALLLAPLGGIVADRFSRRRTILLCDLIAGLVILALAAVTFFAPGQTFLQIVAVFVTAICLAFISSFFAPAISAAIPDLVPSERLSSAYAMGQFSQQISVFIGQGVGGTLFRILGGSLLFFINGFTFLFSAFSQLFIRIPQPSRKIEQQTGWGAYLRSFWGDLLDGLNFIKGQHGLRDLVLATSVSSFFSAPLLLLLPFYVKEYLGLPEDWYGYLLATTGIGSILGYVLISIRPITGVPRMVVMLIAMFLESTLYAILVLTHRPAIALVLAFFVGALTALVTVNISTMVQLRTPAELRGRVGSLLSTISGVVTPIAFGLSGIVADATNRNLQLIYLSCSGVLACVVLLIAANPHIRAFLAYDPPADAALPPA
ncbi:MAG: MFS transporter, partial [Oscillochloris sp.]|nr:MFS transporter [Oscillochloris sp.]